MSKSSEIHRQDFPYCHPFTQIPPPSRAAQYVAEKYSEEEPRHRIIVDSGCGEGQDSLFLLKHGFSVVALDASQQNLQIVSQNAMTAAIAPEMLTCHGVDLVERIPLEDGAADVVLDVWVLGSVILPNDGRAGARQYLTEAHRILKRNGLLVCQFETLKPRRSAEKLEGYFTNLVKGLFSITISEPIAADYALYLDVPIRQDSVPALFVVACKEV